MGNNFINPNNPVIAWWSGGITSAITCWLCIQWFGVENVRVVFIDTFNESEDTYRFMRDCEKWYGKKIETISHSKYTNIKQVWYDSLSLNVATGAKCSEVLKLRVREKFQAENKYSHQAFGFDITEIDRAKGIKFNHPKTRALFPCIMMLLKKQDCFNMLPNDLFLKIEPPEAYKWGFQNNNCWQTGCVQGGIGYWQKMERERVDVFDEMAIVEHELTDLKGEPVTMLKDQGKDGGLVFLKPHPKYPHIKHIGMMKGRPVKPLMECNGFCGSNDFSRNTTELEINFSTND